MTISIIGAGNVGLALGRALASCGEFVKFGVTDPTKYADAVTALGANASVDKLGAAIQSAEIVIMAVPYAAALKIAASTADWGGRILVDATNPIAPGLAGLAIGTTSSGAEAIASAASNARVVKAFNSTGAENMADSRYPDAEIFMPVCGDDADARGRVIALAKLIGFDAVDLGELKAARYVEPFAMMWIHLAIKQGAGRRFAFSRLKR